MKSIKEFILELTPFIIGSMVFAYIVFIGILIGRLMETNLTGKGDVSFWEMLSAIGSVLGAIAVPIALACWGVNSEKHKTAREQARIERDKAEQRRKEDKEYISNYVKEELRPLTYGWYDFKALKKDDVYKDELRNLLHKSSSKLCNLEVTIGYLSYSYVEEFLGLIDNIMLKIRYNENLSIEEIKSSFISYSVAIYSILFFLLMDEIQYQEKSLVCVCNFINQKGNIRDLTLEVLSAPKYKRYYDSALEEIKEQDKK